MDDRRPPGIVLFGPTSSGKTALSLQVGTELRSLGFAPVVLNADSRQIYRGMDIGTSKIRADQMRGIEHRLLDIADPASKLPLERYLAAARQALRDLQSDSSAVPIVVGGTGVYVKGLLEKWDVAGSDARRRALERDLPRSDPADAHRLLRRLSPNAAQRVHPNNYDAIINTLVRVMADDQKRVSEADASPFKFYVFGLDRGPAATDARAERALDDQLANGLLEEIDDLNVRLNLIKQIEDRNHKKRSVVLETHGYREFLAVAARDHVRVTKLQRARLAEARSLALEHVLSYSRRQRSWFRKLPVLKLDPDAAADAVVSRIRSGVTS